MAPRPMSWFACVAAKVRARSPALPNERSLHRIDGCLDYDKFENLLFSFAEERHGISLSHSMYSRQGMKKKPGAGDPAASNSPVTKAVTRPGPSASEPPAYVNPPSDPHAPMPPPKAKPKVRIRPPSAQRMAHLSCATRRVRRTRRQPRSRCTRPSRPPTSRQGQGWRRSRRHWRRPFTTTCRRPSPRGRPRRT